MKVLKLKLFLFAALSVFLNNSFSYSQIKNCNITFFDSNHVMKSYSHVSLDSLNSDTLLFSELKSTHRLHIKNLIELEHSVSKSHLGFIIGAVVGFSIGVYLGAVLSGRGVGGSSGDKSSTIEVIAGGAFLGVIGGVIGGIIYGSPRENFQVDFQNLSLNQKRKEVKNIFKEYGNFK